MAVREKDNLRRQLTVKAKVARKDKDGKRVKEVVDGKKVTVYDEVEKTDQERYAFQTACQKTDAESSLPCNRSSGTGSWKKEKH